MTTLTARASLGTVFGAVGTAANAVSSVLQTTVASVAMLDKFVSDAAERQRERAVADMAIFRNTLLSEKSQELAEHRKHVLEYCRQSTEHEQLYQAAYTELGAVMASSRKQ
jgi:hypothetical protein